MSSPGDAAEQLRAKDEKIAALEAQLTVLNKTLEISEYAKMKARVKELDEYAKVVSDRLDKAEARAEAAEKKADAFARDLQVSREERKAAEAKLAEAEKRLRETSGQLEANRNLREREWEHGHSLPQYYPGCSECEAEREARRAPEAKGPAQGGGDAKRVHVRGNPTSTSSEASRSDERGHDETTTETA